MINGLQTQTATCAAATPTNVDFPVTGYKRVQIAFRNTGANAIGTCKVYLSLDGTYFSELTPVSTPVGSTASGATSKLIDIPVIGTTLRVELTSASGSTASVSLNGSAEDTDDTLRVDAQRIGGQSVSGTITGETITATGDINAAGGMRRNFGPFVRDNIAANLTDSRLGIGATGAPQLDLAVPRAGSLVDICAAFTVAPAGSTMTVSVFKNGTLIHATGVLSVTAGATLGRVAAFDKDTANLSFAAGDRVGVAITTDGSWTATTSDISVTVGIEC